MPYNLPQMARHAGKRRNITLRPIIPTQAQATDLAQIMAPAWQIWQQNIDSILAGYDPPPLAVDSAMAYTRFDGSSVPEKGGDTFGLGATRRTKGEAEQEHGGIVSIDTAVPVGSNPTAASVTDTADQVQAAINSVANEFLTILTARITPALQRWVVQAERVHRSKWAAAVKAGVGVDLDMMLAAGEVQEALSTFMARNTALVRNVSDQAQGRISDAVFRGYERRAPVREVAKEIREATGLGRDRAVRIAADQSSKLSSQLDRERQAEAGLTQFKWRHSGKAHPRSWHKVRDGKVYDSRTGKPVDGGEVIPADDRAGMAPWCGCREQAYIALLDEVD